MESHAYLLADMFYGAPRAKGISFIYFIRAPAFLFYLFTKPRPLVKDKTNINSVLPCGAIGFILRGLGRAVNKIIK